MTKFSIAAGRLLSILIIVWNAACTSHESNKAEVLPKFTLIAADTMLFNSFVDCNMAEAWIGDTFRIFPGKYGEDTVWGPSNELFFANGKNSTEAFSTKAGDFHRPLLPGGDLVMDVMFSHEDGNIDVVNPDEDTIIKMVRIAGRLNAKVQGDNGEVYDESYEQNLPKRQWWKFW